MNAIVVTLDGDAPAVRPFALMRWYGGRIGTSRQMGFLGAPALTAENACDILGRVTNITYRAADGSLVRAFSYEYDPDGLISQKITVGQASPPVTISYTYDGLGHLVFSSLNPRPKPICTKYGYEGLNYMDGTVKETSICVIIGLFSPQSAVFQNTIRASRPCQGTVRAGCRSIEPPHERDSPATSGKHAHVKPRPRAALK
jgi:hypothetical protein